MPTTYFPFRWMVGTFQEILDSSSGNWVRIKSITDLRVLSFLRSCEVKYSSTELNFGEHGRRPERGCRIVLRSPRFTVFEKTIQQRQAPLSGGPAKRMSEKKLSLHHFLFLCTFTRVPAGALLCNL